MDVSPEAASEYVPAGHSVTVTNEGGGVGATGDNYRKAGATALASHSRDICIGRE